MSIVNAVAHPPIDREFPAPLRMVIGITLAVFAGLIALFLGITFFRLDDSSLLLTESTPYKLGVWVTEQAERPDSRAHLAVLARAWASTQGQDMPTLAQTTRFGQSIVMVSAMLMALGAGVGMVGVSLRANWVRPLFLGVLLGFITLLFIVPTVEGEMSLVAVMLGIVCSVGVLAASEAGVTRLVAFFITIAVLLLVWEGLKLSAQSVNYAIRLPQSAWQVTAYPTLDDALIALKSGEVMAVFAERNELRDLMPAFPDTQDGLTYIQPTQQEQTFIFPIEPSLTGRLAIALRENDAPQMSVPSQLVGGQVGAVSASFALTRYLSTPREVVLVSLHILNDLNLPHLQTIASAFLQPARRNGEFLLIRILGEAATYTWSAAALGFGFGAFLGLVLGVIFAHSRLLERALLPYVVASQTVPILAIAPMIVIGLGASLTSVAVIAVYITFFPVAINTLRGLLSPSPLSIELLESYATSQWGILWKLRFPSAMPYIFSALKVSATASVVGAIIGELPSGISDGLGRAILNFSSDYSPVSTPKLWATIIVSAFVGVVFFTLVSLVERVVLRHYVRSGERDG